MFMFKLAEVGGGKKERKKGPGAGAAAGAAWGCLSFLRDYRTGGVRFGIRNGQQRYEEVTYEALAGHGGEEPVSRVVGIHMQSSRM